MVNCFFLGQIPSICRAFGNPAVAMGIYAAVLHALGNIDKDLALVAKDDVMGRQMQDLNLMTRKRASRRK